MRTPLNKKRTTLDNKAFVKKDINAELQKVAKVVASIDTGTPQKKDEYIREIEAAKAAQEVAQKAKEYAGTEEDFINACDAERHACERERFYSRMLDKVNDSPRMEDSEYFSCVAAVENVMNKAASEYREAAHKAMADLIAANRKYMQTACEADDVLESLDLVSRVLQNKYRFRVIEFVDLPPVKTEDRNEWEKHKVRYSNGRAYEMAISDPSEKEGSDEMLRAAWRAVEWLNRKKERGE